MSVRISNGVKVSIIIPVYNGEATIKKAVDSVLGQNFSPRDFKILVVNDASTDNTLEILKSYGKKIKVINNSKNQGAVKTANKGFRKANGKYVIKLDSDDYFGPDILKKMVAVLDKKPEIDFIYCDYYEKTVEGSIKIVSTKKNIFNTVAGGIMFRKEKLRKEGFYDEKIRFPEYDLLFKIQKKWTGYHIPGPLF